MRVRDADFQQCVDEQMLWLKECRDKMVAHEPIELDPYHARTALFTHEMVTGILESIKEKIDYELKIYGRTHHAKWQGQPYETLRTPRYLELPYEQQVAIVQGLDRIAQRYRLSDEEIEAERVKKEAEQAARIEAQERYAAERAANLAADPHFYDNERCPNCGEQYCYCGS